MVMKLPPTLIVNPVIASITTCMPLRYRFCVTWLL